MHNTRTNGWVLVFSLKFAPADERAFSSSFSIAPGGGKTIRGEAADHRPND